MSSLQVMSVVTACWVVISVCAKAQDIQAKPDDASAAITTTICEVVSSPSSFDGKTIELRGDVFAGLETNVLYDKNCGQREQLPARILFAESADVARTDEYKKFWRLVHSYEKTGAKRRSMVPDQYTVTATLISRFNFAAPSRPKGGNRGLLLIKSVRDVVARPFDASFLARINNAPYAGGAAPADKDLSPFKNFTYPFSRYRGWPHELKWKDMNERNEATLVDGKWPQREPNSAPGRPFSGLTLESITQGDVTGDGVKEAIVVLRYDTGGTQYSHYVYIYSLGEKAPKLLAYFHAGDRAAKGLYRVYAQRRNLVVELFDPAKRQGDCCSDGFIRKRFRWSGTAFKQFGRDEHGTPREPSRLDVDTFGRHQ